MKPSVSLRHEFVEYIPSDLKDGTIYVSMTFATAVHKCCCGCGNEVVTPLSPTDWKLIFDGVSITLHPSIGNWSFDCQSHYFMRRNQVIWAPKWSQEEIDIGRARERSAKKGYFESADAAHDYMAQENLGSLESSKAKNGFWRKLIKCLSQFFAKQRFLLPK